MKLHYRRYMTLSFRSIRSSSFRHVTNIFRKQPPPSSKSDSTSLSPESLASKRNDEQKQHPSISKLEQNVHIQDDSLDQPTAKTVYSTARTPSPSLTPPQILSSTTKSSSLQSFKDEGRLEQICETTKRSSNEVPNNPDGCTASTTATATLTKNPAPPKLARNGSKSPINLKDTDSTHNAKSDIPINIETSPKIQQSPTTNCTTEAVSNDTDSSKPITKSDVSKELKKVIKPIDIGAPLPLKNLGNTCYENSIIQCLFSLTSFMYDFQQKMHVALEYNKNNMPRADVEFKIAEAFHRLYDGYLSKKLPSPDEKSHYVTYNDIQHKNGNSDEISLNCRVTNGNAHTSLTINPNEDPQTNKLTNGNKADDSPEPNPSTKDQTSSANSAKPLEKDLESKLNELKTAVGKKSSQFNSTHQQDASEFFYHVIDSIQEYFQSIDSIHDEKNPITRSFELELNTFVACVKCGHKTSTVSEKIRTLSLTIPDDEKKISDSRGDSQNGKDSKQNQSTIIELTLQNALVNYFRDDLMEFKCSEPDCDSKEKTRKCMIRKLPEVLFMTLARYSHSGQKNLEEIKAPFEIYVPIQQHKLTDSDEKIESQTVMYEDDNKYQLVAVVCHLGPSLNTGHYTSFVYNQENGNWYSCDDDAVTKAETKQVEREARRSGYCFFYAHKSTIAHPQLLELSLAKSGKSPSKARATLTSGTTTTSSTPILANGLNGHDGGDHAKVREISQRRTKSSTSISSTTSAMSSSESIESSDKEDDDEDSSDNSSLSSESSSSSSSSSQSSISLNLANLSERSASDRCMTAGCKLFGDKETNYWLCAMCFELQKQELQSYHSEREKT